MATRDELVVAVEVRYAHWADRGQILGELVEVNRSRVLEPPVLPLGHLTVE